MSRLGELKTPIFWVEGHPGPLERETWTVQVNGLCEKPRILTWQDIISARKSLADARLTSVTRFSVRGTWGGVKVSDIMAKVGAGREARYVRFWSYRGIYDTSVSLETALSPKTLLAYEFDGEVLEEDYGGPVRLFCPYLWGYKWAKSVIRIELMDHYVSGFWEKRGYPDTALITAGKVRDMNSGGKVRSIPDGEVIRFLDE